MFRKLMMITISVLCMFGSVSAKKMAVLNFNKGEISNMNNACAVSLTEEHVEKAGDYSMKAEFEGKEGGKTPWAAVMGPERAAWNSYKTVNFEVFNTSDKPAKFTWMIKGAKKSDGLDNRKDWEVTFAPGKSKQSINITGEKCNDGKSSLDISSIYIWAFWAQEEKPVTLYFQKLYLADGNETK